MEYNKKISFGKGLKGFVVGLLAQLIPLIPEIVNQTITADWGDMTIKSVIIALLVMVANYTKHKLIPKNTNI